MDPPAVSSCRRDGGGGAVRRRSAGSCPVRRHAGRWLVLAVVIGLLYSVRPVRLKERGLGGVAAYGIICAIAYAVVPWAWLGAAWRVLAILAAVVFLDQSVNLHFHQVLDYQADRGRSSGTYAVRAGLEAARRTLRPAAGLAFVCMLGILLFLGVTLPLSGVVAVLASVARLLLRARMRHRSARARRTLRPCCESCPLTTWARRTRSSGSCRRCCSLLLRSRSRSCGFSREWQRCHRFWRRPTPFAIGTDSRFEDNGDTRLFSGRTTGTTGPPPESSRQERMHGL